MVKVASLPGGIGGRVLGGGAARPGRTVQVVVIAPVVESISCSCVGAPGPLPRVTVTFVPTGVCEIVTIGRPPRPGRNPSRGPAAPGPATTTLPALTDGSAI